MPKAPGLKMNVGHDYALHRNDQPPEAPGEDAEVVLPSSSWGRDNDVVIQMLGIPQGPHGNWNRYDTDDLHVLHLWADGTSYDITTPRRSERAMP